eukprot:TRINITY_DN12299_c0_g1_i3.p1 TRINITY_DN12299_c0_g1~~TRINITY_DN12299_c0_g1_i3.p1  ORF type:complete len:231 (+),score=36.10 TRINITY_DN12299_c0_g1_i3:113-805(+)
MRLGSARVSSCLRSARGLIGVFVAVCFGLWLVFLEQATEDRGSHEAKLADQGNKLDGTLGEEDSSLGISKAAKVSESIPSERGRSSSQPRSVGFEQEADETWRSNQLDAPVSAASAATPSEKPRAEVAAPQSAAGEPRCREPRCRRPWPLDPGVEGEVGRQRCTPLNEGRAPRISRLLYLNLDWSSQRRTAFESQLDRLRQSSLGNESYTSMVAERVPGVTQAEAQREER